MLMLKDLSIRLEGKALFNALNQHIKPGTIFTVMGASGVGKSTLLAAIGGFLPPIFTLEGDIILEEQSLMKIPTEKRRVGMLFQDAMLFPHLSVAGNIAFGLPAGNRRERTQKIAQALKNADLEGFENRDPASLSGGQRARVALLRALAAEPRVLLLDEPFARLDTHLREQFRQFVFQHIRERGLAAVLVTHDPDDAQAAKGEILRLS